MKMPAWFRSVSVVLVAVLALTLATPAPAEAIEPFTILAIAGAATVVVILIVYLIVANVHGDKMKAETPRMLACVETDSGPRTCAQVASVQEAVATLAGPTARVVQAP